MAWTLLTAALEAAIGLFLKAVWEAMMTDKCCIKGCARMLAQRRRGLCLVCYGKAKAKVDAGEVTWDKLAALGLCKPDNDDPFEEAYQRATDSDNHARAE